MSIDNPLYYLKKYMKVARRVRDIVREIDPDARIYVFGSVVRGRFTASSDIDILVVTEKIEKKYEIMVRVYKATEAPIELHVVTPKGFLWYKRFSGNEMVEVR
ncbi:MAG: nucleotidyltransferase domain-containing protein [Candidatus Korarchaeota archaeon]|nr:nucleotidyltransferase domain-containing protein [Candidatus Korarchaeota archaeon]